MTITITWQLLLEVVFVYIPAILFWLLVCVYLARGGNRVK